MDENTNEATSGTNETAAEMTNGEAIPDSIALPFDVAPGSERYWSARVDDRRLIFRRGLITFADMSFAALSKKLGTGFTINDRAIVGKMDSGAHLTIAQVHAGARLRWQFTLVTVDDPV
jgi:hypothetical protein